jgi:acyl-CoA synthetase (AMP-forming)/AMP-acid ligase II
VIDRIVTDRARNTPWRVAIDYHDRLVTYGELGDGAERFADTVAEFLT